MDLKKISKSKSLILTSNLLLAIVFIGIISLNVVFSYQGQKKAYEEQFYGYGTVLKRQIETNLSLIQEASQIVVNKQSPTADAFVLLRNQLFAMTDSDVNIPSVYLMLPDKVERDGKKFLVNLQTEIDIETTLPGTEYEMNATFETALDRAIKDDFTITPSYTDVEGTWVTYVSSIKDDKGKVIAILGIDFDYAVVQKSLSSMLWSNIIRGGIFSVIAIVIIAFMVRIALRPLHRLAEVSKLAAQGDLTVTLPVTSMNEIGQAASAFNIMMVSLRELTNSIQHSSLEVSESATNLQRSAEQTAHATNEISEAIEQIAFDSDTQLQSTQECQKAMTEMAIGIQRIAESSSVVSELAADTTKRAATGDTIVMNAVDQMQTIEVNLSSTVGTMKELEELSGRIGDILSMIADVSSQTNLLALNASIEAARAGEHGKGFAVVAHEIRKLAERSMSSSGQIGEILEGIRVRTGRVVESLEYSAAEAHIGTKITTEAGDSFRAIVQAIRQVSDQVQEVSAASEQMSAGSEQIAASLDELGRISSSSALHSQRVAASSEEQLTSMEEVASSSEQLLELASNLNNGISRFRV
ncbi:methyl-accepting chemotaxis protein [Paenibacillus sp. IHBB 10380]|uniref:methyl-accepting chemotaxis protein n=1 Tax=Paenibacillus sp. IHBB 10380 TaxID=1566358 RepID=UPI000697B32B|nr:methyl-accepting chemotaxis protein [Paenibacillus sp. IHBB 10380]